MIFSCKDCVPPERHTGCHQTCEKYIEDKIQHQKEKAEYDKQKAIDTKLRAQALHRYRSLSQGKYK